MSQRIVDLSHPIHTSTPPWPGCPPVEIEYLDRIQPDRPEERHVNSSRFAMNIHCGTHMDAPFHFINDGHTIDQIPLPSVVGPATLIDLTVKLKGTHITRDDLEPWAARLRKSGKAIIRTGWSSHWMTSDFFQEYPDITPDAAQWLVDCGVHLVGVETGSVDYPPNDTHVVLLSNEVLIVECLTNLDQIDCEDFFFSAIPLKLAGRDGSPVRALAICDE